MKTLHTPGPWHGASHHSEWLICDGHQLIATTAGSPPHLGHAHAKRDEANARLIAAAPELLEALCEAVDLAWTQDSHQVQFDSTVVFSPDYDFSGLDCSSRIEFLGQHECIVWRSRGKWSAYCTYEGSTWFEQFSTAEEAKEQCMRLLDKVLPDHPAMRARAAILKATGEQQ